MPVMNKVKRQYNSYVATQCTSFPCVIEKFHLKFERNSIEIRNNCSLKFPTFKLKIEKLENFHSKKKLLCIFQWKFKRLEMVNLNFVVPLSKYKSLIANKNIRIQVTLFALRFLHICVEIRKLNFKLYK